MSLAALHYRVVEHRRDGGVQCFAAVDADLRAGYTTLRQANWRFDFPAKRWAITRRLL
jgi:hypothetical protein